MNSSQQANARPCWSTASIGESSDTSPIELSNLHDHLDQCNASRGRLFALRGAADSFNAFVVQRTVTTWMAVLLLLLTLLVTRLTEVGHPLGHLPARDKAPHFLDQKTMILAIQTASS